MRHAWDMPRDFCRSTLRPRHRRLIAALADAMFAHGDAPSAAKLVAFVDEVDRFISFASRTLRFGLVAMLEVLRLAPLFLTWRFATFEALGRNDRVAVLERMERSRVMAFVVIFAAYKAILCLLFFESPDELRVTGYSPERRRFLHTVPQHPAEAAA